MLTYFNTGYWWLPFVEVITAFCLGIYFFNKAKFAQAIFLRSVAISLVISASLAGCMLLFLILYYGHISGWGGVAVWMMVQIVPFSIIVVGLFLFCASINLWHFLSHK